MAFYYRKFNPSNLNEVAEIARKNLTERYSDEIFLSIYRRWPEGFILAEDSGKIVGFISGSIENLWTARILMLAVEERYRNAGIGSALLDMFEREARKKNVTNIRLEVRTDNSNAIKFYQKRKYIISDILPRYYSTGDDAYLMIKILE